MDHGHDVSSRSFVLVEVVVIVWIIMSSFETYTTTSNQSWGSRLSSSFKGILGGVVFILGGLCVLGWNEGNSVAAHRSLQEAEQVCVHLTSANVLDPLNEGKLVHITALVTPGTMVMDDVFQVIPPKPALKLKRSVEMYQWTQTSSTKEEKKKGGSTETETTYTYHKEWVDHVVDDQSFYFSEHHENPPQMLFDNEILVTEESHMGLFEIPQVVMDRITFYQNLSPSNYSTSFLPSSTVGDLTVSTFQNQGYYFGQSQSNPRIGDTRVTFSYVPKQVISVIARQTGSTFSNYITSNKRAVLLVQPGAVSAEEMFLEANKQVTFMAWVWRGVGFLVLFLGFKSIVKPVSVMGDVLPFVGNILEAGADVVCILLSLSVGSLVIAIAWFVFRPVLSIGILAAVGCLCYFVWTRNRGKNDQHKPETYIIPEAQATVLGVIDDNGAEYPTEKKTLLEPEYNVV